MKLNKGLILLIAFLFSTPCFAQDISITVVYNNVPYDRELTTSWGISCFIEGLEKTILFDTGADGAILLDNMKKLEIDPMKIDIVVLSHIHADHTGGLWDLLKKNSKVTVYFPESFPADFKNKAEGLCREIIPVHQPLNLCKQAWSSGELGGWIKEQSLIIDTPKGLIVITGCAHPGIVNIVKSAKGFLKKDVYLVLGGFHLIAYSENQVEQIIGDLKELGVKKVGPSHCTGGKPIELFRKSWGEDFIDLGCGAKVKVYF
jgi:7,8-dihydropterin-6-yl-methyl-4-(beta-D-ribofuranosyl)aminobenzene 5'-phosphate synthase